MKDIKLLALLLLLAPCSLLLNAQTASTLSSYSRFGLGLLSDQSQGFNRSMGGVGIGVRIGNRVNTTNPASYSAIDSLSLILDVGMKASFGQMKQGGTTMKTKNASFEYAHVGMHIAKRLGLAAGFMPYTVIGYDFSSPDKVFATDQNTAQSIASSNYYVGSGGLNQAYLGLGWKVYRDLSIGANVSFLWGSYYHALMPQYKEGGVSSSSYNISAKLYEASLKTYKIDLGAQYPVRLTHQDWLNLGVTAGLGHKIPQDAELITGDSTSIASSPFDLPYTFGFGAAWQHKNTLLVAADVRHELWSNCRMPMETASGYTSVKGCYKNMTKVAVGTQWTPNPYGKYWERIQYRAGFSYTSPYLMIDEKSGPKEISLTIGAGVPILNTLNSRSVVNVGLQWLRRSASAAGMVREDYLLLNVGLTFNERWFVKYKIE